ncbi:MAG TPA: DUF1269 domain-containing protein [Thermomicrobiaceae bacterium]|nr:DUF1269 domain-containing protein [Thermomicrobiaceae bacterium]
MSTQPIHFVAIAYDDEFKADEARIIVKRAHHEGIIDVLETAVVVHGRDGKKLLTQDVDLEGKRRTQGHWLGIAAAAATGVLPLIFVGTAAGAVIGRLTDLGIRTDDLKEVGRLLTPGTSALFVLAHQAVRRGAMARRLQPLGGHVVESTLSQATADELEQLLQSGAESAASAMRAS